MLGCCWTWPRYSQYLKVLDAASRIRIALLKIRSERVGGLEAAIWALNQGNVDVDVFQETKLMDGIHARHGAGYTVWMTVAESSHWGGIAVVWRWDAVWQLEGMINFVPNVASFLLTSGSWRFYVVVSYVPPNDVPTVNRVEHSLEAAPKVF